MAPAPMPPEYLAAARDAAKCVQVARKVLDRIAVDVDNDGKDRALLLAALTVAIAIRLPAHCRKPVLDAFLASRTHGAQEGGKSC